MSQPPTKTGWYWVRVSGRDNMAYFDCGSGLLMMPWTEEKKADWADVTDIQNWSGPLVCPFANPFDPDRDYPTAARSIALNLAEFCDQSKPYPRMISDAAREAANLISGMRRLLDELTAKDTRHSIRLAVAATLREYQVNCSHKEFTDRVIDLFAD